MTKKVVKTSWQKPKKAKVKAKAKEKVAEIVVPAPLVIAGPVCQCGAPLAPGQTAVCKDHIRTN